MGPVIQVNIPDGLGEIMESLTRAILKNQPNDIYGFAVVHLESLLQMRRAQSSGLSPSPTEETGPKAPLGQEAHTEEELKISVTDEKPLEEPESNDTSYGVEATAVRTLAASTGTVAILGTTAKVKESNDQVPIDDGHSATELEVQGAKETTSEDLSEKDNGDTTKSSETKEQLIADSSKISENHLEKQREEEGKLQEKEGLRSLETEAAKEYKEANNEIKKENKEIVENTVKKDEDVEKKEVEKMIEKGEVEKTIEKEEDVKAIERREVEEKEVEQQNKMIIKEGEIDESLASRHDKIEISAKAEATKPNSMNVVVGIEKEPVRIVDYQEKKDRGHEPKIVEEMSVKKEEILMKVNHSGGISLKKEDDFEKVLSFDKQEGELIIEEIPEQITVTKEDLSKTTPESEPASPDVSKTEEENDISSEQLKTNSLSDMSLSENLNSEGEEAAREAAKALELKEMVASLSATANSIPLDYGISEHINNTKDVSIDNSKDNTILNVLEKSELFEAEPSTENDVPEGKVEENGIHSFETSQVISEHSSEKEPSSVTIPETSEETISSSENSQEENGSNRLNEGDLENFTDRPKDKVTDGNIQENQNFGKGIETKNITDEYASQDKTDMQETSLQHKESDIQQKEVETLQSLSESKETDANVVEGEVDRSKEKEVGPINVEERVTDKIEQNETKEQMKKTNTEEILNEKDQKQYEETDTKEILNEKNQKQHEEIDLKEITKKEDQKQHEETDIKIIPNEKDQKQHEETDIKIIPNEKDQKQTFLEEVEEKIIEKENKDTEEPEMKDNPDNETVTAATIIQSSFRGYQVRKILKESEGEEVFNQVSGEIGKDVLEGEKRELNRALPTIPGVTDTEGKMEKQENDLSPNIESVTSETVEEKVKHVPESLMKIAQAEVDKICKEAEKATESLMTPPLVKDDSEIENQEEDFPAPPDELLTSESQNEEIKEDQSSSGTTEPTMPLGSNHTECDSSKTEDTTAPSLAESEMPKTTGQFPSLQNEDFRQESSVTENINTEIAMQRDSTEGELTMEEDSMREDDVPAPTPSNIVSKTDRDDSLTPEEEKAATVIQAGYRGFKTRKRLREESSTRSGTGSGEEKNISNESSDLKSSIKDGESNNSDSLSSDKSEKELNDSAKKIQAGVRGYLVRKKQRVERDAAVTIQSHFRGFKTRQRLKQKST